MRTTWMDLIPGSPFCRPCWRWDLANWHVRSGQPLPSRFADAWVERARHFLTGRQAGKASAGIREAAGIFRGESSPSRWLLEAYLLTGKSLKIVADRCVTAPSTAEAFAQLFFDVQPYLSSHDWIVRTAVGTGQNSEFSKQDIGQLWKAFGYHGGIAVLDTVVAISLKDGLVSLPDDLRQRHSPVIDEQLRQSTRLAIVASMLAVQTRLRNFADLRDQVERMEAQPHFQPVAQIVARHLTEVMAPGESECQNPGNAAKNALVA